MAAPVSSALRTAWILLALGAPWLVYACGSAPLGASGASTGTGGAHTTTSSRAASSSGATTSTTAASSGAGAGGAATDAGGDAGGDAEAGVPCGTAVVAYPLLPGIHVPVCSYIAWPSNPPTSGEHYPIWAAYQTYTTPVPRGFYVHDEEHGAVVITYNCPSGCDADLAQLTAWLDARPADPACTPPVRARIVVTPDPLIPTRFAAAAWGWALTSQCFDLAALGPFIDAHYAMAPEDFCSDGVDVTVADAGVPDGCGTGDGG